jgi:RHS repeat-associated protein
MLARHVHGPSVDELVLSELNGAVYYYHQDHLNSTVAVTDENGNVVEQYRYDVYGQPYFYGPDGTPRRESLVGLRFLFTGREWLASLGLYDYRHRLYSPSLGRFLQMDPLGFEAGEVNVYLYCANNPVNFSDPYGLVQWRAAGGAILGVIGNTFGLALGFGLALVPEPTMATKVAAVAVVGKSSYGFGANVNNLVAAFRDQASASHGALANDIAELVAPGNANAQRVATIADLTTDLAAGRIAGAAARNVLGRLYPYDMERVFYMNPDDLGPLARGLQVFDLLRINYDTYSDLYRGSDDCK